MEVLYRPLISAKEGQDHELILSFFASLILYVSESTHKQDIRSLYESFSKQDEMIFEQDHNDTYVNEEFDDSLTSRHTIRGQKEKQKENEKEKEK